MNFLEAFKRKKPLEDGNDGSSQLDRVLGVFDLTSLGVGATLGAGVYILTGSVAKESTGPAVVVSFFIAAIVAMLAGVCYAEFGARVPKAGSGYIYSYVTVGELCAFVIGWNLILSYIIGASSVARAWTANIDALFGKTIEEAMVKHFPIDIPGFAKYPDFFAFAVIMMLTLLVAFGVKEVVIVNKILSGLNVLVVLLVIFAGYTKADLHNWSWTPEEIADYFANSSNTVTSNVSANATNINPSIYGSGGFLPYGFGGLLSGTATCFYAFVGFDCIATTGEEAINPQRSIPLGIIFSLLICCVSYLGVSSSLTLMQPYFLLDKNAPLPYAFGHVGMSWAAYPISIGAICALTGSLIGAIFPMPRVIYAMASDGLLFKFFAKVNSRTRTPLNATLISGFVAGVMAVLFDLKSLVDLMSIGTLAAYTLVAASVLVLRYRPDPTADYSLLEDEQKEPFSLSSLFKPNTVVPTEATSKLVNYCCVVLILAVCASCIALRISSSSISMAIAGIFCFVMVAATVIIRCQPQSCKELSFSVPLVPFVPVLNIIFNIALMIQLDVATWYKMLAWMLIGMGIYCFYGVSHSLESDENKMLLERETEE